PILRVDAPGLEGGRLDEAAALARLGAVALPALVLQAVCGARLFAEQRFTAVYAWLGVGGLVGLGAVLLLTPTYGAAGAVVAFSPRWWTAGLGLLALSQHREIAASSVVRSEERRVGTAARTRW